MGVGFSNALIHSATLASAQQRVDIALSVDTGIDSSEIPHQRSESPS